MRKQVSFLADLFKETSKCLLHLPGLFFQPILTFLFLLAFLMFWIFVVVRNLKTTPKKLHIFVAVLSHRLLPQHFPHQPAYLQRIVVYHTRQ